MTWRCNGIRPAAPGAITLAFSLLVLAACGSMGSAGTDTESAPPPPRQTADRSSETVTPVSALDSEAPDRVADPPAAEQKTARAPINDDPDQLIGLAPHALSLLLGPPSLLRTELPAQVWQYSAPECVLDVYLYAEEERPDLARATYYEIRRAEFSGRSTRICFGEFLTRWIMASESPPES
jgi:hypothetical protein